MLANVGFLYFMLTAEDHGEVQWKESIGWVVFLTVGSLIVNETKKRGID